MNTKTIYCSDMYFIRNLSNDLNKKYHFDYVIFKTLPQYLTLYYYIIYIILLCMFILQKPRNTDF